MPKKTLPKARRLVKAKAWIPKYDGQHIVKGYKKHQLCFSCRKAIVWPRCAGGGKREKPLNGQRRIRIRMINFSLLRVILPEESPTE